MSDQYSLTTKWQRGEITTTEFWRRMGRLPVPSDVEDEEDRETLRRKTWWPKEP